MSTANPGDGEGSLTSKGLDKQQITAIDTAQISTPSSPTNDDGQKHTTSQNEDPATVAASEELKHTTISDKNHAVSQGNKKIVSGGGAKADDFSTPEPALSDTQDEEMRERLSSPKKKRGRDQDDDGRELLESTVSGTETTAEGAVNGSKQTRLEPQKKRVRDGSEDRTSDTAGADLTEKQSSQDEDHSITKSSTNDSASAAEPTPASQSDDKPVTSASAFAKSGFASLAGSSTSPFGSVGAAKPSVFGGGSSNISGFGALAASKSPTLGSTGTTSGFGALATNKPSSGFGFGGSSTSGFGALGRGSAFGSALGNGFAGGTGPKLSSFAAPGTSSTIGSSKPAKAFGAPDSDADESDDGEGSDEEQHTGSAEDEVPAPTQEEKKKSKLQRVQVEDGEAGEATLLHVRAKLFALASKESGWKERGVGTLKINAPQASVSFDEDGQAIPGSYDPSALEDNEEGTDSPKLPRLIMRQENTHRVILNTALLKHMVFKDKPGTSSAQLYFTAIEGDKDPKPISMLLKMNESNAEMFRREVASIQRE